MKKLLSIIFASAMIITLFGCKKQSPSTNSSQPVSVLPSTADTTPIDIQQRPMYAVSLVPQVEETTDNTGKVRFRYTYQNLTLVLPEPEVADKIILDYLTKMDQTDQYAEELCSESLLEEYKNMGMPFMYDISYIPKRFDANILSIHKNAIVFTGGIHSNNYGEFFNYDLLSGKSLKLSDVVVEGITEESIADIIVAKLSDYNEFYPNYKDTVTEMLKVGLEAYEYWYFTENGLCFHYDPYTLASYFEGPITAEIPYSELIGILKDEYFPAEQDLYHGDLNAKKFTVDSQAGFTQFAEVILSENSTKILLSAEGAITNIIIQAEDSKSGIATTVMAVQSLTPGDALMVEFDPETTKLLVRYQNGDQLETKTITYNGDNIIIS